MDQLRLHGSQGNVDCFQIDFLSHTAQPLKALQHIRGSLPPSIIFIQAHRKQPDAVRDSGHSLPVPGSADHSRYVRPVHQVIRYILPICFLAFSRHLIRETSGIDIDSMRAAVIFLLLLLCKGIEHALQIRMCGIDSRIHDADRAGCILLICVPVRHIQAVSRVERR